MDRTEDNGRIDSDVASTSAYIYYFSGSPTNPDANRDKKLGKPTLLPRDLKLTYPQLNEWRLDWNSSHSPQVHNINYRPPSISSYYSNVQVSLPHMRMLALMRTCMNLPH